MGEGARGRNCDGLVTVPSPDWSQFCPLAVLKDYAEIRPLTKKIINFTNLRKKNIF